MAERMIRKIGDPVLREPCQPVREVTPNITRLLDDLAKTIYGGDNRAGLAAPQVGIAKRIAVLDYVGSGLVELINPVIVERSGKQSGHESCLSIPGAYGLVKRSQYVKVMTWNRQGKEVFVEGTGDLAICLQHEIDHLDGVLYIDHVKPGELYSEHDDKPLDVFQMIRLSRSGGGR